MKAELRALVVDDDADARTTMSLALRAAGFEVETAEDGAQGWEVLSSGSPPPVVLVDWMMPGEIDGLELCRRIRRSSRSPEHYVILVTARSTPEDLLEGLSAGADDFLAKPFDPDDLLARIRIGQLSLRGPEKISDKILAAIAEARSQSHGEIVVRAQAIVGQILFRDGDIYWAYISTEPDSLLAALQGDSGLGKEEEAAILAESRKTGRDPTDVLLDWGFLDGAQLRSRLRSWIRNKLKLIFSLENPEALYLPTEVHEGLSSLGFSLEELYPEAEQILQEGGDRGLAAGTQEPASNPINSSRASDTEPPARDPELDEVCHRLMLAVAGSRGSVLFDLGSRAVVGSAGEKGAVDALQLRFSSLLPLFDSSDQEVIPLDDVVLSGGESHSFAWREGSRVITLETGAGTKIGMVRFLFESFSF